MKCRLETYFKMFDSGYASHWSAQKESCLDVCSFKGLNTIYENISKYHCKLIDLKYAGQ